jgi:hypothetical protein
MKAFFIFLLFPLAAFSNNIFDSHQTIKMKITAPFQTLFAKKSSNNLTELNSMIDGTLEVFNEYTQENEIYEVQLKMRGNMTLANCEFPKLKLKLKKEQTTKKRLFNRKSYDLATHCINQLKETDNYLKTKVLSVSPHRESFIFDLQRDIELASPLTRNAVIDYIDNSIPDQIVTYSHKDAFLIESTGAMIKRLNGLYAVVGTTDFSKKISFGTEEDPDDLPQKLFTTVQTSPEISIDEVLRLTLFQILVVNLDYFIKVDQTMSEYGDIQLWNVKLIAKDEKKWLIYGNDYNLAMMTYNEQNDGSHIPLITSKNRDKFKSIGSVQERRSVVDFYQSKKEVLYSKIESLEKDPIFKNNYKKHLDIFYQFIDTLAID